MDSKFTRKFTQMRVNGSSSSSDDRTQERKSGSSATIGGGRDMQKEIMRNYENVLSEERQRRRFSLSTLWSIASEHDLEIEDRLTLCKFNISSIPIHSEYNMESDIYLINSWAFV